MAGKRTRKSAASAAAASGGEKSSMEESASQLAGVDALMTGTGTGSKRKAASASGGAKKNIKITKQSNEEAAAAQQSNSSLMARSNSIEKLAEVAGELLGDGKATASSSPVPNPMATVVPGAAVPTGFRKKGSAAKSSAAAATKEVAVPKLPTSSASKHKDDAKKTQVTYNPDIPMTKEQLTSWRREMRRVRNRESAAASRRKVRDRIEELEHEVEVWKRRYREVVERLGEGPDDEEGEDLQVQV